MEETENTNEKPEPKDLSDADGSRVQSEDRPVIITAKPKKIYLRRATLLVLLVVAAIALAGSLAFWWRDNLAVQFEEQQAKNITSMQNTIKELTKQLEAKTNDSSSSDDSSDCTAVAPDDSAIENIKASVSVGNTQPLEGYMASSVNTILAATEAYGPRTPTQSVGDITSFISGSSTWDFSLSASVLSSYGQSGYGQYFPNIAIVGKSTDGKVISFSFDCNGDIDEVFMASNELILG